MKKKSKIIISVILVFIAGVITGICTGAFLAHHRIDTFKGMGQMERRNFMMQHIFHKLALSEEQQSKIEPLVLELQQCASNKGDLIKELLEEQKSIVESELFDEVMFRNVYKKTAALKEDSAVEQALIKRKIYLLLNDEQKKNIGAFFKDKGRGPRGEHGKNRPRFEDREPE